MKKEVGLAGRHEDRTSKRSWEPMTLIRVGNLGAVILDMSGSFADTKGGFMSKP